MMCSEMEIVIGNTYFWKKGFNKFIWQRIHKGRLLERAVMEYVIVERSALGLLVDVHEPKGMKKGYLITSY